ncbi:MAG: hypothetical protein KAJ10_05380 [Thermodesulfovibrionia bacterium]|nr:hypothetical protein [Thermodesulfovibrionia bacterium]
MDVPELIEAIAKVIFNAGKGSDKYRSLEWEQAAGYARSRCITAAEYVVSYIHRELGVDALREILEPEQKPECKS